MSEDSLRPSLPICFASKQLSLPSRTGKRGGSTEHVGLSTHSRMIRWYFGIRKNFGMFMITSNALLLNG
jgi:hypothetical protein